MAYKVPDLAERGLNQIRATGILFPILAQPARA